MRLRVPGWMPGGRDTLEVRRNILGEPTLRTGWAQRSLNPYPVSGGPDDTDVLSHLVELGKAIPEMPKRLQGTTIDLTDREKWDNGSGKSPYARWNEILSSGEMGWTLRSKLEPVVMGDEGFAALPAEDFTGKGGAKLNVVMRIISPLRTAAMWRMLKEYPDLDREVRLQTAQKRAGRMGGNDAIQEVERLFNGG
jgi:hypothetical protein